MDCLAHNREGPYAHGHHGNGLALAARAFQQHAVAVLDALFLGQLVAHFHIQLGFGFKQVGHVARFAAATPVLGEAIGGQHNGEARIGRRRDLIQRRLVVLVHRAAELLGERVARQGRFSRFVVLGERPVGRAGAVELGMPVLDHDKGQLALGVGHGRPGAVGHVAHPLAAVPFNNGFLGIEGLAVHVHRGTVVQDAAVDGPAPRPVGEEADIGLHGRLAGVAPA